MANNALIQGAALTAKKFVDVGEAVEKGISSLGDLSSTPTTVKKNDDYQNTVNDYMSKMKTGMDFSSFSNSETAAMRNFLMGERARYADAAKKISKLQDTTSPEYMEYVDVMNNVNNSFTNLAEQVKAYKKGKLDYAKDQIDNSLSKGMDPDQNRKAMLMYGFYDKNKDKKSDANYDAPFQILDGGNIGFNIDGQTISFNDAPAPVYKDYDLANTILKNNEAVYKSGTKLTKTDADMYRMQLEQALQNPNSLKSIVYDFEKELNLNDIGNIWDANKDKEGVVDQIRNQVIDRLVNARNHVAQQGESEKARIAAAKAASKQSSRRGSGRSNSGNSGNNAVVVRKSIVNNNGKNYEVSFDKNGGIVGEPKEVATFKK